jgi:hypothetical protein
MNAGTLIALLRNDQHSRESFKGIVWSDSKFPIKSFPASLIFNTDKYKGPGIHWCAAYFIDRENCDYFDPFGFPPFIHGSYDFLDILAQNSKTVKYNGFSVQAQEASTCGHHCAFFILLRSRNNSMKDILQNFYTRNTALNDNLVKSFIDHQLKHFSLT